MAVLSVNFKCVLSFENEGNTFKNTTEEGNTAWRIMKCFFFKNRAENW